MSDLNRIKLAFMDAMLLEKFEFFMVKFKLVFKLHIAPIYALLFINTQLSIFIMLYKVYKAFEFITPPS